MTHTSTPSPLHTGKRKSLNVSLPSRYSMKIVLGYSAALRVVKSHELGDIELILN